MHTTYEYAVRVPIVGFIEVTVTSDVELSDDEVLDEAYEQPGLSDPNKADHWEYESMREITRGNVFYGPLNRFDVELVDTYEVD